MNEVRILAFDPGTANTGYATLTGNLRTSEVILSDYWGVLKTSLDDGSVRERIDTLGEQMKNLIYLNTPTHVVIEDFTEQGKLVGKTYKEMSWLIEHMRMVGRGLGHEVTIYENAEWKKIAMGTSRLNKAQIKHFVAHHIKGSEILLTKRTATHVWDSAGIGFAKFKQLQGER